MLKPEKAKVPSYLVDVVEEKLRIATIERERYRELHNLLVKHPEVARILELLDFQFHA